MTQINRPAPSTSTDARVAGWIVSLILHGTLAFGTFLFLQQIKLAPQQTPFKWNVAMVAPAPQAAVAPPPTAKKSTPPTPVAESAARSAPSKFKPAVQPLEPPTLIENTRTAEQTPSQAIAEQIPHPVAEQTPLTRTVETADHPVKHTEQITPFSTPAVPASQPASTASTVQSPYPPPSLFSDSAKDDPAPQAPALSAPFQQTSSTTAEPALSAHDEATAVPKDTPLPQQATAPPGPQVASLSSAGQAKSVKADYGWLADLMAKWIENLDKRYPAMLRTDGVTGRVTLTALLHQDGVLSDVRVAKSSGNAQLDQVAIEDIKNGPPVKLSRPLERPHMPVKFSIVYDLKAAR